MSEEQTSFEGSNGIDAAIAKIRRAREVPRFSTYSGNVIVGRAGEGMDLGSFDVACKAMADFLAAHDFEDRPAMRVLTLDEAGKCYE